MSRAMKVLFSILVVLCVLLPGMSRASSGGGGGSSPYVALEPPFVVNLKSADKIHFLQIKSQVKLANAESAPLLLHHMAMVRHTLLMLFSEQSENTIRTLEGKEALREESLTALQEVLEEETGEGIVEQIYFTDFVIQ